MKVPIFCGMARGSLRLDPSKHQIFKEGNNFRKCPAPLDSHSGSGEEVAIIDPAPDAAGTCTCGLHNEKLGLALSIQFQKKQLPWLTNWQHWGKGEYVTGIEPGTHPPVGQAQARKDGSLILLEPGESRSYDVTLEVRHESESIQTFLNQF